jgi:peptidyl-prolyl cis-trans isomerase D
MTMLDRMRRHKGWLKWSLALVVVAFILLYIPSFLGNGSGISSDQIVAKVGSQEITVGEFRRAYQRQIQVYRASYAGMNERMLKQLGVDQQILQQMLEERAEIVEARRLGLSVTDAEVSQFITSYPMFQENGRFIGLSRYQQLLGMQRPPMTTQEFEDQVRNSLLINKLHAAVTSWVTVSDSDVRQEFLDKNQKVKLEVVPVLADKYRSEVKVTDAEVSSWFDSHRDAYKIGEKRKVRYLLLDPSTMRSTVKVPSRQVEQYYNDNIDMYTTPEQVRASHILFKTDGKDDAAVKAKAEEVLKEARAGADFAELAKKYSQDEETAKNGGDLDYFARGRMVPEFDQVVFAMQPGQISDLVKTQYGYHIIKLIDKKPAQVKPLSEVRQQIVDQLTWERAQATADELADKLSKEIASPSDLDKVARQNGLKVEESGFVTRDEPIMALGGSPQLTAVIFTLKEGQVTPPLQTQRGWAFLTLSGTEAPRMPKLDEVRDKVSEDLVKQKIIAMADQKAEQLASEASSGDLQKAAKAAGLEVKTTELIARESAIPDIGVSPQVDAVAFALRAGQVSKPIKTDNAVVVIKVLERKDPTEAEIEAGMSTTREQVLDQRRSEFFSAFMSKAREGMDIAINHQAVQQVVGL